MILPLPAAAAAAAVVAVDVVSGRCACRSEWSTDSVSVAGLSQ